MTYWQYHLLFTLPLLVVLTVVLRHRIKRPHILCWLVLCGIVFVFTTPWDNYAVFLGIWGFGEGVSLGYPFSSQATQLTWLGHIPFEEYSFFLIEATLVCLVSLFFLPNISSRKSKERGAGEP